MGLVALWRLARESWAGAACWRRRSPGPPGSPSTCSAARRLRAVAARRDPGRGRRRRARHGRPAPGRAPRRARRAGRDRRVRAVRRPRVLRRRQPRPRPQRQQRAGRAVERLAGRLRRRLRAARRRRRAAERRPGRWPPPSGAGPGRRPARGRRRRLRRRRVGQLRHARLPGDNQGTAKYLLAATGSQTTAPIIIETGKAVVTIGGFSGRDNSPTVAQLEEMVAKGELKYVLASGKAARSSGVTWVQEHGTAVDGYTASTRSSVWTGRVASRPTCSITWPSAYATWPPRERSTRRRSRRSGSRS